MGHPRLSVCGRGGSMDDRRPLRDAAGRLARHPHSGTLTQCRTHRSRRPPCRRRARFPTSPHSKASKRSGVSAGPKQGTYLFDRIRAAQTGREGVYSIDTPPPTAMRQPAHRARVLVHAHRHQGALRAHARQERVLPDGLGRQRPAHRAPRAELLRRALRPVAALRPRLHAAVRGRRQQVLPRGRPAADQPPQLHRAVRAADR